MPLSPLPPPPPLSLIDPGIYTARRKKERKKKKEKKEKKRKEKKRKATQQPSARNRTFAFPKDVQKNRSKEKEKKNSSIQYKAILCPSQSINQCSCYFSLPLITPQHQRGNYPLPPVPFPGFNFNLIFNGTTIFCVDVGVCGGIIGVDGAITPAPLFFSPPPPPAAAPVSVLIFFVFA